MRDGNTGNAARADLMLGLLTCAYTCGMFYSGPGANLEILGITSSFLELALWVWSRFPEGTTWSRGHWLVLFFLGWLTIVTWFSTIPENSFYFWWLFASFGIAFFVSASIEHHHTLSRLIWFLPAAVVSALWGIAEFVITLERANGPIIDPNLWASIHNLLFFLCLAVILSTNRNRLVLRVLMLLFAIAVASSYSRTAGLIFAAALCFCCTILWKSPTTRGDSLYSALIGLSAFAIVELVAYSGVGPPIDRTALGAQQAGWSLRLATWSAAFQVYLDFPLLGAGPGTFKIHYPQYRQLVEQNTAGGVYAGRKPRLFAAAQSGVKIRPLLRLLN